MVFHIPIMLAVRVGKLAVGKVDDAVSDPNDAEYQARKRGEKQDGKLRKILVNAAKKGVTAVSGDGRPACTRGDASPVDSSPRGHGASAGWAASRSSEEEELPVCGRQASLSRTIARRSLTL